MSLSSLHGICSWTFGLNSGYFWNPFIVEIQFFDENGMAVPIEPATVTVLSFPPLPLDQQDRFYAMLRGERMWSIDYSLRRLIESTIIHQKTLHSMFNLYSLHLEFSHI